MRTWQYREIADDIEDSILDSISSTIINVELAAHLAAASAGVEIPGLEAASRLGIDTDNEVAKEAVRYAFLQHYGELS